MSVDTLVLTTSQVRESSLHMIIKIFRQRLLFNMYELTHGFARPTISTSIQGRKHLKMHLPSKNNWQMK